MVELVKLDMSMPNIWVLYANKCNWGTTLNSQSIQEKTTYRQSPWTYPFVFVVHCYLLFLLKFHQINCHLYPPLEFPLGNGGPGPHDYLAIWILWVFHLWPLAFFRGILVAIWPHLVEAGGSIFLSSGLSSGTTSKFAISHSLDTSCAFSKKRSSIF